MTVSIYKQSISAAFQHRLKRRLFSYAESYMPGFSNSLLVKLLLYFLSIWQELYVFKKISDKVFGMQGLLEADRVLLLNLFLVTVDIISNISSDGVGSMAIDQNSLNRLLTALTPKNHMAVLREQRTNLLQKLRQSTDNGKAGGVQQQAGNIKSQIRELAAVDQQIAQEIYDETSRKLEAERLEREAAFAKKERDRERALAKHERLLENRSMSKLLSAAGKVSQPGGAYSCNLSGGSRGDKDYVSDVDRDLQESVEYGIAAAQVAARRKNAEAKAQIEASAERHQATHRKKTKRVNIKV